MEKEVFDATWHSLQADRAAAKFNPGQQPDIAKLMIAAYTHGYRQALIDRELDERGKL